MTLIPQEHPPRPWHTRAFAAWIEAMKSGKRDSVICSATGSGKTYFVEMAINHVYASGGTTVFICNRRALADQVMGDLQEYGVPFGSWSATHEQHWNPEAPVQICMSQTFDARILKKRAAMKGSTIAEKKTAHPLPEAQLVVVDEPHMQGGSTMEAVLREYRYHGVPTLGMTATPVELSGMFSHFIQGANNRECRDTGAHCWLHHYAPFEMDLSRLDEIVSKRVTGEYNMGDVVKKIYNQQIYGEFVKHHVKLNPDLRPALFYGPDVKSSIYAAKRYVESGIRAACVDGSEIWMDGKRYKSDPERRRDLLEEFQDLSNPHRVRVITNRWVFREAIDIPCLYHVVFGVPIRQLHNWVQMGGRAQRSHPSKTEAIIQDHGGNYQRLGSLNADRDWETFFELPKHVPASSILSGYKDGEAQPIVCPECGFMRMTGFTCPSCKHQHDRSVRKILTYEGDLVLKTGDAYKPRFVQQKPDTEELWRRQYFRYARTDKTFSQAYGKFYVDHGYQPPRQLKLMPRRQSDWFKKVRDIPLSDLY